MYIALCRSQKFASVKGNCTGTTEKNIFKILHKIIYNFLHIDSQREKFSKNVASIENFRITCVEHGKMFLLRVVCNFAHRHTKTAVLPVTTAKFPVSSIIESDSLKLRNRRFKFKFENLILRIILIRFVSLLTEPFVEKIFPKTLFNKRHRSQSRKHADSTISCNLHLDTHQKHLDLQDDSVRRIRELSFSDLKNLLGNERLRMPSAWVNSFVMLLPIKPSKSCSLNHPKSDHENRNHEHNIGRFLTTATTDVLEPKALVVPTFPMLADNLTIGSLIKTANYKRIPESGFISRDGIQNTKEI